MASKNKEFTERLLQAIADTGLDKPAFAEKSKVGYSTLMTYFRRVNYGRVPEWDQLVKISEASGKTIDWLLTGKEPPQANPQLVVQETPRLKTFHRDFALDNYIPIRLIKDAVAAGTPREINEYDVDGWVLIYADKTWMQHNPENYTCCRVRGSSMTPILTDGDIVAIDHADRDPRKLERKIVAFRKNGAVTIKWLKTLPDGLVIGLPQNPHDVDAIIALKAQEIETGIVGRVAWWWAKR